MFLVYANSAAKVHQLPREKTQISDKMAVKYRDYCYFADIAICGNRNFTDPKSPHSRRERAGVRAESPTSTKMELMVFLGAFFYCDQTVPVFPWILLLASPPVLV
jgi:hypothetical protein